MKASIWWKTRIVLSAAVFALGTIMVGCSSSGDAAEGGPEVSAEGASSDNAAAGGNSTSNVEDEVLNGEGVAENGEGGDPAAQPVSANGANNNELKDLISETSGNASAIPANGPDGEAAGADPFAPPPSEATATLPPANGVVADASAAEPAPVDPAATAPVDPAATALEPVLPPAENTAKTTTSNTENTTVPLTGGLVPEPGTLMPYYVQRGDTLGIIATKIFGNKAKWRDLAELNKMADPSRIYSGDVVFYALDNTSKAFAEKYEGAPRKTVTVQQGETLASIAKKIYGTQQQWRTLWKENGSIKNPDRIAVGAVLTYRDMNSGIAALATKKQDADVDSLDSEEDDSDSDDDNASLDDDVATDDGLADFGTV